MLYFMLRVGSVQCVCVCVFRQVLCALLTQSSFSVSLWLGSLEGASWGNAFSLALSLSLSLAVYHTRRAISCSAQPFSA